MFKDLPVPSQFLPEEFRGAAEKLFPASASAIPDQEAAEAFAFTLGIGEDYRRLLLNISGSKQHLNEFLEGFQNNLYLLIRKAWVEKGDEGRKYALEDRTADLVILIEKEDYKNALKEFGIILGELAYLLFGSQSLDGDFIEYAFRIDTQMGLFWWYASMLARPGTLEPASASGKGALKALLLLGICYLTNF